MASTNPKPPAANPPAAQNPPPAADTPTLVKLPAESFNQAIARVEADDYDLSKVPDDANDLEEAYLMGVKRGTEALQVKIDTGQITTVNTEAGVEDCAAVLENTVSKLREYRKQVEGGQQQTLVEHIDRLVAELDKAPSLLRRADQLLRDRSGT